MRERDTSGGTNVTTYENNYWWCDWAGYSPAPHDITYASATNTRKMWDIVTPNFHKLIARGVIINNAMYKFEKQVIAQPNVTYHEGSWDGISPVARVKGRWALPLTHPNLISTPVFTTFDGIDSFLNNEQFTADRERAITKAWSNVDESEIQALASLGEMPETVKWIADLFYRAQKVILSFKDRKKVLRSVKRFANDKSGIADAFSDLWLEFRYAFRPLVFEMQQAMAACKKAIDRELRHTARGFARNVTKVTSDPWVQTEHKPVISAHAEHQTDSNYRAGVLYAIKLDVDEIMAVWGFDQPIETIWELTPFSFIIDWFFNIGDVISSWSVSSSLVPRTSWIVEHHRISSLVIIDIIERNTSSINNSNVNSDIVFEIENRGRYEEISTITRRLPSPDRPFSPHINIKLDVAKLTDLATIGRSLMKGLFK